MCIIPHVSLVRQADSIKPIGGGCFSGPSELHKKRKSLEFQMSSYSGATVTHSRLQSGVMGRELAGTSRAWLHGALRPLVKTSCRTEATLWGVRTTDVCQEERQNAEFQSSSESRVLQGEISRHSRVQQFGLILLTQRVMQRAQMTNHLILEMISTNWKKLSEPSG